MKNVRQIVAFGGIAALMGFVVAEKVTSPVRVPEARCCWFVPR